MDYVSERITNIAELEQILEHLSIAAQALNLEIAKDSPSMYRINELSKTINDLVKKANAFEFIIDRRKTSYCE